MPTNLPDRKDPEAIARAWGRFAGIVILATIGFSLWWLFVFLTANAIKYAMHH